jgi:hypothetical protein
MSGDVVVLRWPEQASDLERLDKAGLPRLLLVEPGVAPPTGTSCLEDWLRLPADETDVRARMVALTERAARHPPVPSLDEHGQLSHGGQSVFLSNIDKLLARVLVEHLGRPVPPQQLIRSAWSKGGGDSALRVHLSRLRRHLAPLGLTIVCVRGHGYVLRGHEAASLPGASVDERSPVLA